VLLLLLLLLDPPLEIRYCRLLVVVLVAVDDVVVSGRLGALDAIPMVAEQMDGGDVLLPIQVVTARDADMRIRQIAAIDLQIVPRVEGLGHDVEIVAFDERVAIGAVRFGSLIVVDVELSPTPTWLR